MFDSTLKEYELVVNKITVFFARKYFGNKEVDVIAWVGGEIGSTFFIHDYWFNFDDMLQYLKYGYTKKQMFEHYDYDLNGGKVCIRDWKKLKKQGIIKVPTK